MVGSQRALYPGLTHAYTLHHGLVVPDIIAISENCPNLNFPFSFQSTRFKERLSRSLKETSCRTLLPVSLLPHLVLVMANLVLVLANLVLLLAPGIGIGKPGIGIGQTAASAPWLSLTIGPTPPCLLSISVNNGDK